MTQFNHGLSVSSRVGASQFVFFSSLLVNRMRTFTGHPVHYILIVPCVLLSSICLKSLLVLGYRVDETVLEASLQ